MKALHSIQKYIFDDKLNFGVIFFSVIESSMPYRCLKKYWMKIINFVFFMNNSVQRGQNEKF